MIRSNIMDFARKQLEKYGWTDGKGLGKNENGISQPLKPKLKRSITGVGYDAAADLTEQWWSALYNKAASNVEVEEKNGKTKKIKRKSSGEFEITNSTWKLNKKKVKNNAHEEEYSENFVKIAVLTSGGCKTEKVRVSDSEEDTVMDIPIITDEQLFAACEGRTAHKGARHGLKALGKLARVEEQEKLLLQQAKYDGYSQTKKNRKNINEIVEQMCLNSDSDLPCKKKKKKKKHCTEKDNNYAEGATGIEKDLVNSSSDNKCVKSKEVTQSNVESEIVSQLKKKKKKLALTESKYNDICVTNKSVEVVKKRKKKNH